MSEKEIDEMCAQLELDKAREKRLWEYLHTPRVKSDNNLYTIVFSQWSATSQLVQTGLLRIRLEKNLIDGK